MSANKVEVVKSSSSDLPSYNDSVPKFQIWKNRVEEIKKHNIECNFPLEAERIIAAVEKVIEETGQIKNLWLKDVRKATHTEESNVVLVGHLFYNLLYSESKSFAEYLSKKVGGKLVIRVVDGSTYWVVFTL